MSNECAQIVSWILQNWGVFHIFTIFANFVFTRLWTNCQNYLSEALKAKILGIWIHFWFHLTHRAMMQFDHVGPESTVELAPA